MKQRWLQLKFIWEYATHLQTDSNPPLDLIFKFIYGLDKKDIIKNFNRFNKTETSKKVFEAEVDVIDKIKTGTFKPGTFGHEFQTWLSKNNMVDLFTFGYESKSSNIKRKKFFKYNTMEHDLIHFLNGYDTTALGEVGVLSFNLAKEWREGYATILYSSFIMSIRNTLLPSKYPPKTPWYIAIRYSPIMIFCKIVIEGWRRGKRAPWFMDVDWDKYLDVDLQQVKKELQLEDPPKYWTKIQPMWRRVLLQYKRYARKHGATTNRP